MLLRSNSTPILDSLPEASRCSRIESTICSAYRNFCNKAAIPCDPPRYEQHIRRRCSTGNLTSISSSVVGDVDPSNESVISQWNQYSPGSELERIPSFSFSNIDDKEEEEEQAWHKNTEDEFSFPVKSGNDVDIEVGKELTRLPSFTISTTDETVSPRSENWMYSPTSPVLQSFNTSNEEEIFSPTSDNWIFSPTSLALQSFYMSNDEAVLPPTEEWIFSPRSMALYMATEMGMEGYSGINIGDVFEEEIQQNYRIEDSHVIDLQ